LDLDPIIQASQFGTSILGRDDDMLLCRLAINNHNTIPIKLEKRTKVIALLPNPENLQNSIGEGFLYPLTGELCCGTCGAPIKSDVLHETPPRQRTQLDFTPT
jgi:hypothetical protein